MKKRIYHYTTLDSLECILSNKTIRLSVLSEMDDILEGYSMDFDGISKYYYVSSWSFDGEENIPLWYMYTNELKGVRIEADEDFLNINTDKSGKVTNVTNDDTLVYPINSGKNSSFLIPVKYQNYIDPAITSERGYIDIEKFNDIGRIKPKAWEFQNEVRFRLYGINKKNVVKFGDNDFVKFINSIINEAINETKYIDIKFDIEKINNANFLLGPAAGEEDFDRLNSLIKKYITKFEGDIEKSNLQIRYKQK
ncbi:DUF2971 domain-containing protein [Clostridium chrysemydis]|uniref:DUF2971 domain-containing protein n=1 Tax=Clostridium chrysemydis TaxID=2665504 RepID=UPI001883E0D6|nr:DUF2971 domain-containing protein [Clostridium chrysemydis]